MKTSRRLGAAVLLTLLLGLSTFAGDVLTPPCAPGDVLTPPCATQPVADASTDVGEATTVSNMADTYSITEASLDVLQIALPLF